MPRLLVALERYVDHERLRKRRGDATAHVMAGEEASSLRTDGCPFTQGR